MTDPREIFGRLSHDLSRAYGAVDGVIVVALPRELFRRVWIDAAMKHVETLEVFEVSKSETLPMSMDLHAGAHLFRLRVYP